MTRAEFERRYGAMPGLKKAELIEGVVYLPSPVGFEHHSRPHRHLSTWLGHYEASTHGMEGGDNASVRLDLDNEPQPDAFLRIAPDRGGQSRTSKDDIVEGAPELVAEVSSSTASYDLDQKLKVYRRNGVLEYLVWRVNDRAMDWFASSEASICDCPWIAPAISRAESFPASGSTRMPSLEGICGARPDFPV